MHPFFEKLEHYISRLIPYILILLAGIIILEVFFSEIAEHYHLLLAVLDGIIIAFFAIDLIFLARKCKSVRHFFKNYYLDVLAIFPFALFFELVNEVYRLLRLGREFTIGQAIFHETLEAEKMVKAEKELRLFSRTGKLSRYLKIAARSLRLLTKSRFFTKLARRRNKKYLSQRKKK